MRKPFVAGNWKMNKTVEQATILVQELLPGLEAVPEVERVLCPPFPTLMMVSAQLSETGIGFLFILFLILKLTGVINWSWWWVTSPLWIPFALAFGIGIVVVIITIIAIFLFSRSEDNFVGKLEKWKEKIENINQKKNKKEDIKDEEEYED